MGPVPSAHALWALHSSHQGQLSCAAQARVGPTLHSPQTLALPQVAAQTRDIIMAFGSKMSQGHCYHRAMDPDTVFSHGMGQDFTMASVAVPTLPPPSISSSASLHSAQMGPHLSFCLPTTRLLLTVVPALPVPCGGRWGIPWVSSALPMSRGSGQVR